MCFKKNLGFILLIFFVFCCGNVRAQNATKDALGKQISFTFDNDVLIFKGTDRYYTNGLFLNYSHARKNNKPNVIKNINNWEIGQMIFTPQRREISPADIADLDRPITGYLYGKFTKYKFLQNNHFWQWGASVGTIGKHAYGFEVLDFVHPFLHINNHYWGWIWDYQLKSELGLNAHAAYALSLIKNPSFIQVTPRAAATLGTSFTNINPSVLFQIGKFNPLHESSYWNSRIGVKNASTSKKEIFFFYRPQLLYQTYNATVQGGFFSDDKGPLTSSIQPFIFTHELGIMFATKKYSLSYDAFYQGREATTQVVKHAYARLKLDYRFR